MSTETLVESAAMDTISEEQSTQSEKESIMDDLGINSETYDIASLEADKVLKLIHHNYIVMRGAELKVQSAAKLAEEERLLFEKQHMENEFAGQLKVQATKRKTSTLIYRIIIIKLLVISIGSVAIGTMGFSNFELYTNVVTKITSLF
jgi:hypothetical protein